MSGRALRKQQAALQQAAGIDELTGYSKYDPFPEESQAWTAAKWRRAAELRKASGRERELYQLVKSRFRGGIL